MGRRVPTGIGAPNGLVSGADLRSRFDFLSTSRIDGKIVRHQNREDGVSKPVAEWRRRALGRSVGRELLDHAITTRRTAPPLRARSVRISDERTNTHWRSRAAGTRRSDSVRAQVAPPGHRELLRASYPVWGTKCAWTIIGDPQSHENGRGIPGSCLWLRQRTQMVPWARFGK